MTNAFFTIGIALIVLALLSLLEVILTGKALPLLVVGSLCIAAGFLAERR